MAIRRAADEKKVNLPADGFTAYLSDAKHNPEFRAAYEDAQALQRLIDSLVKCRKALHLSQTEVAERMGVRQPTVSGFETERSDPKLSTLQRYARAVEAHLRFKIEMPAHCDWVARTRIAYNQPQRVVMLEAVPTASSTGIVDDWKPYPSIAAVPA
ncbi:MAG: helix-turn-helix domain-containing protein [Frankiaceae bacterium]|nr:helix-turn-helix domain-containing protein [Frankiaceae bacterium]MBV9870432.1 helix-turn-helix domain-containing protein [Frankiaceae bacterium]